MIKKTAHRRALSGFLSLLFFVSNSALAYSPEINFWKQRQANQKNLQATHKLASLPASMMPFSSKAHSELSQSNLSKKISNKFKNLPNRLSAKNKKELKDLFSSVSATYGTIRDISIPKSTESNQIVLFVQDVHQNNEAQSNISKTLQSLINREAIDLIGLEGSFSRINLKPFRNKNEKEITNEVASFLFENKKITAPIFTGLTSTDPIPLFVGVDDHKIYTANVNAYVSATQNKNEIKKEWIKHKSKTHQKKKQTLNPSLWKLDQEIQKFWDRKKTLGNHISFLNQSNVEPNDQIKLFLRASDLEDSLNSQIIEKQRTQVLESLIGNTSKEKSEQLIALTLDYKSGKIGHVDFFQKIEKLCIKAGVNLNNYPEFQTYIDYLLLSDRLDPKKLFTEVRQTEKALLLSQAKTSAEKLLIEESRQLYLIGKLLDFALTKDEWEEYKKTVPSVHFFVAGINLKNTFELFYRHAEARDKAISDNLVRAINENKAKTSVLITGGFHFDGIQSKLNKQGITTVSFVPKISKVDSDEGTTYLSIFTQEKTPLEKLFQGDNLFVSQITWSNQIASLFSSFHLALQVWLFGPAINVANRFKTLAANSSIDFVRASRNKATGVIELFTQNGKGFRFHISGNSFISWPIEFIAFSITQIIIQTRKILSLMFAYASHPAGRLVLMTFMVGAMALTSEAGTLAPSFDSVPFEAQPESISRTNWANFTRIGVISLGIFGVLGSILGVQFIWSKKADIPFGKFGQSDALVRMTDPLSYVANELPETRWRNRPTDRTHTITKAEYRNLNKLNSVQISGIRPGLSPEEATTFQIHKSGLELLKKYESNPSVQNAFKNLPSKLNLNLTLRYDSFLGLDNSSIHADVLVFENFGSQVDLGNEQVGQGLVVLSALSQLYSFYRIQGQTEQSALEQVINFYDSIRTDSQIKEDLSHFHAILGTHVIDPGNIFIRLLQRTTGPIPSTGTGEDATKLSAARKNAETWYDKIIGSAQGSDGASEKTEYPTFFPYSGKSEDELTAERKDQWVKQHIQWFLSAREQDQTIDIAHLDEVLDSDGSRDAITQRLLDEVEAPGLYDSTIESKNARRKQIVALEEGQALTVSRFGRASYFLTMLASASRFVLNLQLIEKTYRDLQTSLKSVPTDQTRIAVQIQTEAKKLQDRIVMLQRLSQPDQTPSQAKLRGAIRKLRKAVQQFRTQSHHFITVAGPEGYPYRSLIDSITLKMDQSLDQLDGAVDTLPTKRANFSVLIQRASPTNVEALEHLRRGESPFGYEEHIEKVIQEGGDMMHGSRDDVWFEVAQFWIEALPLYIHEEKVTLENGEIITKVVIEQEAMENVLRHLAIRWKKNIDQVMDTEHVSIARILTVELRDDLDPNYKKALAEEKQRGGTDLEIRERAALKVFRHHVETNGVFGTPTSLEEQVAAMAAIAEQSWRYLSPEVARIQGQGQKTRFEALWDVFRTNKNSGNYMRGYFNPNPSSRDRLRNRLTRFTTEIDRELQKTNTTFRLKDKRTSLLENDLTFMRRREIPTWIILTTQASGMSNAFAGAWVDESMALYNVTTGFTHDGRTLEEEARSFQRDVEDKIVEIGREIIKEFGIEYEIGNIVANTPLDTNGMTDEQIEKEKQKRDRRAILELIRGTSDLAEEVAKAFVINQIRQEDPNSGDQKHPYLVQTILKDRDAIWELAVDRVIAENKELQKDPAIRDELIRLQLEETDNPYMTEVLKYVYVIGRDRILDEAEQNEESREVGQQAKALAYGSHDSLPPILRMWLSSQKGMTTARQVVIAKYWDNEDGTITPISETTPESRQSGQRLDAALNDPIFSYLAEGPNKKYNRGYGPSRVDLGMWERFTTEILTQWIGAVDKWARRAMQFFYELYNFDVRPMEIKEAEQMKPFENANMESSLAVSHLFVPLFQAIGVGNMLHLAYETNQRSETFIRAPGCGSSGFCQPKDIYFLPFVNKTTVQEILNYAGIPIQNHKLVQKVKKALKDLEAEENNQSGLESALTKQVTDILNDYLEKNESDSALALPTQSQVRALTEIGMGDADSDIDRAIDTLISEYHAKVIEQLESRMRFAPVYNIHLLQNAFRHLKRTDSSKPDYEDSIWTLPVEYKPVSDARLASGPRIFEYLAGQTEELMIPFGDEGEILARYLLKGFDVSDEEMRKFFALRLFGKEDFSASNPEDGERIERIAFYARKRSPADLRMVTPFNLSATAIYNYVTGNRLQEMSAEVYEILTTEWGLNEDQIRANSLTHGAQLFKWDNLDLTPDQLKDLNHQIGNRLHALVLDVRLNDPEYRATKGSDLWESIRGSDVTSILIHYPEMTGIEDEGTELAAFGQTERMIDDLGRIRDTMQDNRSNSALIIFDSPVQGRKGVFDRTAIKQWLALGGWYVNATVAQNEVEKIQREVEEEKNLMRNLVDALKRGNYERAEQVFQQIKQLAGSRYERAEHEGNFANDASSWWRGAGFNNWSERHHYVSQAWNRVDLAQSLSDVDLGTLTAIGLMHLLNGETEKEILENLGTLHARLNDVKGGIPRDISKQDAETIYLFIKPKYEVTPEEAVLTKGESTSLKAREESATTAAGKALQNREAELEAHARAERMNGYGYAQSVVQNKSFEEIIEEAYNNLGDGKNISNRNFGIFMAFVEESLNVLINELISDPTEKNLMLNHVSDLFYIGRDPQEEAWAIIIGKGDDKGDIGRLALAANGNKNQLRKIAKVGGLMDITLILMKTLKYERMSSRDMSHYLEEGEQNTVPKAISSEVTQAIAEYYSRTLYDHTFDYIPAWMHPAKSDIGFTDFNTYMGHWLGRGKPFTRNEVLELAAENHRWANQYLDHLFETKTWMANLDQADRERTVKNLLGECKGGNCETIPIGVAGQSSTNETEKEWWTYTQKRELAQIDYQGHNVEAVFENFDAEELIDSNNRVNIGVIVPTGRPHLTVLEAEGVDYNDEYSDEKVNLILTRSYEFKKIEFQMPDGSIKKEKVMLISDGYMYLDRETFIKARVKQGKTEETAAKEADDILKKNPKGIPVAVRFNKPLINSVSMPFHGAPHYLHGLDENIGLPTMQSYIHNLTPGYSKGEEHRIYKGTDYYPEEYQWYTRYHYDDQGNALPTSEVERRIINGHEEFPGLKNISWRGIIAKPYKQSGGRGALPQNIRDEKGRINEEALFQLAHDMAEQGRRDDLVVQRLISSSPYLWASPEMIDQIRIELNKKGISLPDKAPLFVYSRIVTIEIDGKTEYVLELVVSSRMAVSNVGLGGVLFKWRKSFANSEELAKAMTEQRKIVAEGSLAPIERRSREVWDGILEGSPEIDLQQPDYKHMRDRLRINRSDRTGRSYTRPRIFMHDLLDVPVVRFEDGHEVVAPDIRHVEYVEGELKYFVVLDTREDGNWKDVVIKPEQIVGWRSIKIEDNIGYGLWHPFVRDQKLEELANAKAENREPNSKNWGSDVRLILRSMVQAGRSYLSTLPNGKPVFHSSETNLDDPQQSEEPFDSGVILIPNIDSYQPHDSNIAEAVRRAHSSIFPDGNAHFSFSNFSVILKELVTIHILDSTTDLQSLRQEFITNPSFHLSNIIQKTNQFLNGLSDSQLEDLIEPLSPNWGNMNVHALIPDPSISDLRNLISNGDYRNAIARQVADTVFTETSIPKPTLVHPNPIDAKELKEIIPQHRNHVLIVNEFLGMADEVYPYFLSAMQSTSGAPINAMAAHASWLNENGDLTRILVFDPNTQQLREIPLKEPISPDRVQFFALDGEEIRNHIKLSALYRKRGIHQVNYAGTENGQNTASLMADSKYETTEKLTNLVRVPEAVLIPKPESNEDVDKNFEALINYLKTQFNETSSDTLLFRIQPNNGTEGINHKVVEVNRSQLDQMEPISSIWNLISIFHRHQNDDLLVRREVGNVRFGPEKNRATFRLLVSHAYPGKYSADAGYVVFGAEKSDVASVSQGGRIGTFQEAQSNLFYSANPSDPKSNWNQAVLSQKDLETIKETAEKALEGLNLGRSPDEQLYWGGVDIELEFDKEGHLSKVWVLEVNARPTGSRHAHSINHWSDTAVPSSEFLWRGPPNESHVPQLIGDIIRGTMDESHQALFQIVEDVETFRKTIRVLSTFLRQTVKSTGDLKILLKQQRAVFVLADILWLMKLKGELPRRTQIDELLNLMSKKEDTRAKMLKALKDNLEYLPFINQFMTAVIEKEVEDFQFAAERALQEVRKDQNGNLRYVNNPKGGRGIKITLKNKSPSGKGLASSSGFSLNLLNALYRASGQYRLANDPALLASMAMLLENELHLRSGAQDFWGPLLPGVKSMVYPPTDGFVVPEQPVEQLDLDEKALNENLLLVDSGIPRAVASDLTRGLNMRHLGYISRNPNQFLALRRSLGIHDEIKEALLEENWPRLGRLFLDYMELRQTIDSGATRSIFDEEAGEKVLLKLFYDLKEQDLIHGGMFTGAMGGGVAMVIPTELGKEKVRTWNPKTWINPKRRVDLALAQLKKYQTPEGERRRPFSNLQQIQYEINTEGIQYLRLKNGEHISISGGRMGISSANASDGHTQSKDDDHGGVTINTAININGEPFLFEIKVEPIEENKIILDSREDLFDSQGHPKYLEISHENDNLKEFFDLDNPALRFFKTALSFTGIVKMNVMNREEYENQPEKILEDVEDFMLGTSSVNESNQNSPTNTDPNAPIGHFSQSIFDTNTWALGLTSFSILFTIPFYLGFNAFNMAVIVAVSTTVVSYLNAAALKREAKVRTFDSRHRVNKIWRMNFYLVGMSSLLLPFIFFGTPLVDLFIMFVLGTILNRIFITIITILHEQGHAIPLTFIFRDHRSLEYAFPYLMAPLHMRGMPFLDLFIRGEELINAKVPFTPGNYSEKQIQLIALSGLIFNFLSLIIGSALIYMMVLSNVFDIEPLAFIFENTYLSILYSHTAFSLFFFGLYTIFIHNKDDMRALLYGVEPRGAFAMGTVEKMDIETAMKQPFRFILSDRQGTLTGKNNEFDSELAEIISAILINRKDTVFGVLSMSQVKETAKSVIASLSDEAKKQILVYGTKKEDLSIYEGFEFDQLNQENPNPFYHGSFQEGTSEKLIALRQLISNAASKYGMSYFQTLKQTMFIGDRDDIEVLNYVAENNGVAVLVGNISFLQNLHPNVITVDGSGPEGAKSVFKKHAAWTNQNKFEYSITETTSQNPEDPSNLIASGSDAFHWLTGEGPSYDSIIKDYFPHEMVPELSNGLSSLIEKIDKSKSAIKNGWNWFDIGGGIGLALKEGINLTQKLNGFLNDIYKWTKSNFNSEHQNKITEGAKQRNIPHIMIDKKIEFLEGDFTRTNFKGLNNSRNKLITAIDTLHEVDDPLGGLIHLYNQLDNGGFLLADIKIPIVNNREDLGLGPADESRHEHLLKFYKEIFSELQSHELEIDFNVSDAREDFGTHQQRKGFLPFYQVSVVMRKTAGDLEFRLRPTKSDSYLITGSDNYKKKMKQVIYQGNTSEAFAYPLQHHPVAMEVEKSIGNLNHARDFRYFHGAVVQEPHRISRDEKPERTKRLKEEYKGMIIREARQIVQLTGFKVPNDANITKKKVANNFRNEIKQVLPYVKNSAVGAWEEFQLDPENIQKLMAFRENWRAVLILRQARKILNSPKKIGEFRFLNRLQTGAWSLDDILGTRYSYVAERIIKRNDHVLDLISGDGQGTDILAGSRRNTGRFVGVEPNEEAVELAQQKYGENKFGTIDFVSSSAYRIPKDIGKFDKIVMMKGMEQVYDRVTLLSRLKNSLNPGGKVILSVPHYIPGSDERDPSHIVEFDQPMIESLARKAGFKVSKWHYQRFKRGSYPGSISIGGFYIQKEFENADRSSYIVELEIADQNPSAKDQNKHLGLKSTNPENSKTSLEGDSTLKQTLKGLPKIQLMDINRFLEEESVASVVTNEINRINSLNSQEQKDFEQFKLAQNLLIASQKQTSRSIDQAIEVISSQNRTEHKSSRLDVYHARPKHRTQEIRTILSDFKRDQSNGLDRNLVIVLEPGLSPGQTKTIMRLTHNNPQIFVTGSDQLPTNNSIGMKVYEDILPVIDQQAVNHGKQMSVLSQFAHQEIGEGQFVTYHSEGYIANGLLEKIWTLISFTEGLGWNVIDRVEMRLKAYKKSRKDA